MVGAPGRATQTMDSAWHWLLIGGTAAFGMYLFVRGLRDVQRGHGTRESPPPPALDPTKPLTVVARTAVQPATPATSVAAHRAPAALPSMASSSLFDMDDIEDTVVALARPTAPPAEPEAAVASAYEPEPLTLPFARIHVTASGRSDTGRKRARNEDSILVLDGECVFVVADGMGGHASGEVASQMAVERVADAFRTHVFEGLQDPNRPRRGDELVRAVIAANAAVFELSQHDERHNGMGTTLVAVRFAPNKQRAYIANVGDSRCYRLRDGGLTQLTTDHTLASIGIKGPSAGKLLRAVGTEASVDVDLHVDDPRPGDLYLLCSDGLFRMVPEPMLIDLLRREQDLDTATQILIDTANERGGRDNISAILIRVEDIAAVATANDASAS